MTKHIYLTIAVCALLCACGSSEQQSEQVQTVETVSPEMTGEGSVKHYTGTVKEAAQVSVAFKTAGQLSQILVKEGDHVREGQLIAMLDDSDYLLGVKAAESQYRQLKDEVERLKTSWVETKYYNEISEKAAMHSLASLGNAGASLQA